MRKEKELLREQLKLLAEQSKTAVDIDLASISNSMNDICRTLIVEHVLLVSLFVLNANFFVRILVHIKKLFRRHS